MDDTLSKRIEARIKTLNAVVDEIDRQDELKEQGRFPFTVYELASKECSLMILPILTEEVGEVARALQDGVGPKLLEELIQVAAVASAWAEGLQTLHVEEVHANPSPVSTTISSANPPR